MHCMRIICTAYPSPWWVMAGAPTNCILHTFEGNSFVILFSFTWIGGMSLSLSLLLVLQDIIENSFKLRYKIFVNEKWELILHVHDETLTSNPSHSRHVNLTLFINCLEKIWRQWIWKRYPLTKRVFLDFAILVSLNNGWKTIMTDVGARLLSIKMCLSSVIFFFKQSSPKVHFSQVFSFIMHIFF